MNVHFWRQMNIRVKVIASFSTILVILLAIAALGYINVTQVSDISLKLVNEDATALETAYVLKGRIAHHLNLVVIHIGEQNAEKMSKVGSEVEKTTGEVNAESQALQTHLTAMGEGSVFSNFEKPWADYSEVTKRSVGQSKGFMKEDAFKAILENGIKSYAAMNEILDERIKAIKNRMSGGVDGARNIKERAQKFIALFSGCALALGVLFVVLLGRATSGLLEKIRVVVRDLTATAKHVFSVSMEVNNSSSVVAQSSGEQASAIQETVATLTEISETTAKTEHNAKTSAENANESHNIATQGKQMVEKMIAAIDDIHQSNNAMMNEIAESNKRIAGIVDVINSISAKTQVINDIVFQTKLLSFNASVEAARAGVHGKGFSVVAEEVGSLAQMSGMSAQEIARLLDESTKTVTSLVEDTRASVERFLVQGRGKIENGRKIADESGQVLDRIVNSVGHVNGLMAELSHAAAEQATGVNNITTALQNLDHVTNKNAEIAKKSRITSETLKKQALVLNQIVSDLSQAVIGDSGAIDTSGDSLALGDGEETALVRSS